ncbi:pentatricopeptide repeat-containing protein [Quercus suber]|uniref:Pentatricopeptide repeat-containing protein n=1 Tax=Quercus suber TaxID=58331 RepID=A0AAW0LX99_QUESU
MIGYNSRNRRDQSTVLVKASFLKRIHEHPTSKKSNPIFLALPPPNIVKDPASLEVPVSATLLSLKNQNHSSERWNSIIKHHTKLKDEHAILTTYTQMAFLGIAPDNATLPLVLKAFARLSAVESGKNIHSSILGTSLIGDIRVGTALVDF